MDLSTLEGSVATALTQSRPLVSIAIGTKDRQSALLSCLRSIEMQSYKPIEVLVLDDASTRIRVCDVLAAAKLRLRVSCYHVETSLGVAGGRNYLMQRANGELIIVLDDDAALGSSDDVHKVVAAFTAAPRTGVVAFKIVNHLGDRTNLLIPFSRKWRKKRPELRDRPGRASYFLGGGHALRKSMLKTTGLYQDNLMYYGEELDLAYRVINSGMEIHYRPDIVVHHYPSIQTVDCFNADRYYYSLRNVIWIGYRYLRFPNLATYLIAWIGYYCIVGLQKRHFGTFLRALRAGFAAFGKMERVALSYDARKYLRDNYGRLWY